MTLSVYIVAFIFGLVFLLASFLSGGGEDADGGVAGGHDVGGGHGGDLAVDAAGDAFDAGWPDGGGDVAVDAAAAHDAAAGDGDGDDGTHHELWDHGAEKHGGPSLAGGVVLFPLTSMRFWVFFLTFFGLAGLCLQGLALASPSTAGAAAAIFGYLIGTAAVNLLRHARRTDVSTYVSRDELVGKLATVVLPIDSGVMGRVRVDTRTGSEEIDAVGRSRDAAFAVRDQVQIVGFQDARAVVAAVR